MKTLHLTILCITILTCSLGFARGGSGGGGVLAAILKDSKKSNDLLSFSTAENFVTAKNGEELLKADRIRFLKRDHNEIVFEYARTNHENEVTSEIFKLRPEEFNGSEVRYLEFIHESERTAKWVPVSQ